MSATATALIPLKASPTSKPHSDAHPQPIPHLHLFTLTRFVRLYPQPPAHWQITSDELAQASMRATDPSNHNPVSYTGLLSGPLVDFQHCINQENSQWLIMIDIAHDICDPAQKHGQLWVSCPAEDWETSWRVVSSTDPLVASVYVYVTQHVVGLTMISAHVGRSRTEATGHASTMASCVKDRDQQCWVTGSPRPVVNSHVYPKRMGGHHLAPLYLFMMKCVASPSVQTLISHLTSTSLVCGLWLR